MTSLNINQMKQSFRFGGARPTLYRVTLTNPINPAGDTKASFSIKSTSLPGWNIGRSTVSYMGRQFPLPGDRTFDPWQVDVYNDEDFLVRDTFEQWNNAINSLEGNVRNLASSETFLFQTNALVTQLSKTGKELRTYEFVNIYPERLGDIQLSWEANDQIETFPVVFAYDSFKVYGATGNAGGV